jgi:hypothetical protein
MSPRGDSHDFVYVHTDIPPAMTIREWRAHRASNRPVLQSRPFAAWTINVRATAATAWRAMARALARTRFSRARARDTRRQSGSASRLSAASPQTASAVGDPRRPGCSQAGVAEILATWSQRLPPAHDGALPTSGRQPLTSAPRKWRRKPPRFSTPGERRRPQNNTAPPAGCRLNSPKPTATKQHTGRSALSRSARRSGDVNRRRQPVAIGPVRQPSTARIEDRQALP